MTANPKVLVGTLFSGENEYERSLSSLKAQSYGQWDQFVLKNLPNKEAHERLYQEFMANKGDYDLFFKLDADMVLTHENALSQVVELFSNKKDLDHGEFAVNDWFSRSLIMGVHVTSNRATWEKTGSRLFVDPYPLVPGNRVRLFDGIAPFVEHSPDPSAFQAYHFGVHRALKAFQFGQAELDLVQADYQWQLLNKVWQHFVKSKDRRLGLSILGAEHVIKKRFDADHYDYTNQLLRNEFTKYKNLQSDDIFSLLNLTWGGMAGKIRRFCLMVKKSPNHYLSIRQLKKISIDS